jgi:nucleoside phosphorylase
MRLQGPWRDIPVPNDSTRYVGSVFSKDDKSMSVVAAAAPQMGMSMSAVIATKLIHNFRPRYLCMCGISAGLKDKTNIGDILAPNPSWDWGSGKRELTKDKQSVFSPAPHQIRLNTDIRDKLKAFAGRKNVLADTRAPNFYIALRWKS